MEKSGKKNDNVCIDGANLKLIKMIVYFTSVYSLKYLWLLIDLVAIIRKQFITDSHNQ